jgi:hypothetical protein
MLHGARFRLHEQMAPFATLHVACRQVAEYPEVLLGFVRRLASSRCLALSTVQCERCMLRRSLSAAGCVLGVCNAVRSIGVCCSPHATCASAVLVAGACAHAEDSNPAAL